MSPGIPGGPQTAPVRRRWTEYPVPRPSFDRPVRPALLLSLALLSAAAPSQNPCPDGGFGGEIASFELDRATGTDSHLGVEYLGGEYFVSARGAGAIPPHRIHVFDASGNLLRGFDQPAATATSPWGLRDLASDGFSLFGGDESGIHGFDAQGSPVQQVRARNGLRTLGNLQGTPADQVLGTFRALAFDPDGNGGEGSFWSANFDTDLVEFDLNGTLIRRYSNTSGWSIYGLAHDPCSGSIWAWSDPADGGQIFEVSTAVGGPTGRSIPAPGVHGGLAIHPAADGRRTLVARLEQTGPDRIRIGVLHRAPGVCDALVLRSALDGGPADRSYKLVGPLSTQIAVDSVGAPMGAPLALFFNLGADALACGSLGYLGASWSVLDDFQALLGVTVPAGQPISVPSVGGGRVTIPTSSLPAGFAQALRVQGLWLDPRVPLPYVPLLATNEVELGIDLRPPLGVQVAASGGNSFNADANIGFFSVTNPTTQPITRIQLEAVGGMVFDFEQVGMADRFDGGNSTATGCRGTFRGGSDIAAGIDYASNPVSPCDPSAHQGHEEVGPRSATLTIPFAGGQFHSGVRLQWDVDTDGGPGVHGGHMTGMRVTIDFANGDRRSGVLGTDPNNQFRAVVVL
jgi:hypothetical protein